MNSPELTPDRSVAWRAMQVGWILLLAVAALCALVLAIGALGLLMSDGRSDPSWSWSGYVATMAAFGAVGLACGGSAWLLYRRLYGSGRFELPPEAPSRAT